MNLGALILIIGIIAFVVSCIVQAIKGVALFKKIPTDLVVFVLSIVLTVIAYFAYLSYASKPVIWYMVLAAIICGFIVALVAMNGWEKVTELFKRFVTSAPKANDADEIYYGPTDSGGESKSDKDIE